MKHILSLRSLRSSLLVVITCMFVVLGASAQVKVWEGTITIPTYGWEDDVNPKFWAMEAGAKGATTVKASITYPYNMQDHLSRRLEDKTYKAIYLENEYLKITCLPELGGRLHSVFDKTTNQEAFHRNDVIKPSMIAMRGGFISGGIEWNAGPQVHTVTILSPVDVISGTNSDGSAYIEISNLEKSLLTKWTVRVTLHPGKSLLDEKISIYNPTDAMNPYYFWNCTAFPQLEGTRFIYPMSKGTDHFGEKYFDWPSDDGVDLSWTKNYEEASSIFAVDCAYDFFGAYDVDLDRGIVQVANHDELPGKKAWTWGQGEYGRVSQQNLGDVDPEYIEVQSGPLMTQSDYGFLAPGASVSWQEYWYPVHGLNTGFEFANDLVAAQTFHDGNNLTINLISTEVIDGARCIILTEGRELGSQEINLSPGEASVIEMNKSNLDTVTVKVVDQNGAVLSLFQTPLPLSDVTPREPSSYVDKEDEKLTAEENFLKAEKFDRSLNRISARKYYQSALEIDSLHLASLRNLAILDFESARYDEAKAGLEKALSQIPNDDGLAWYFLGLCHLQNNKVEEARSCGFKASKCFGTEARAFDLIGKSYMLQGNYQEAEQHFNRALSYNQQDPLIYHHLMLAKYAKGNNNEALEMAASRIANHPTEIVPRLLLAISTSGNDQIAVIRDFLGEDDFEILEASHVFTNLGMFEEASQILEKGCLTPVKDGNQNHLVLYQLAYLNELKGNKKSAAEYLKKAGDSYQDFVLASGLEIEKALKYAYGKNPDDAVAAYQLGNLYGNFGRLDYAAKFWEVATIEDPSMSIPWRNLGLYAWVIQDDHAKSERCYRSAIKARPFDQTLYRDLAKVLVDDGKRGEAIDLLEKMKFEGVKRSDIIINQAQYYLDADRYDDCINLLTSVPYFVNWEGSSITWDIFNQANVEKGIQLFEEGKYEQALAAFNKGLTFPENLGVGQSQRTEEAKAWFWKGKTLLQIGQEKEAIDSWSSGASSLGNSETQQYYREMCKKLSK